MVTIITDHENKVLDIHNGNIILNVSKQEAILLIQSLSTQLAKNNSNCNRLESYDADKNYVTIAVEED